MGLIPCWAKDAGIGDRMINARTETLAEKPSFREAFKKRRWIIPASVFYEWQRQAKGAKQPFYFYLKEKDVFGFAGLWEEMDG
jgi:putative SOS response-associated peptidase YedK